MKANKKKQTAIWGLSIIALCVSILLISWNWKKEVSVSDFDHLYKSIDYPAQYAKSVGSYEIKVKYRPSDYHFGKLSSMNRSVADSLISVNDSVVFFDMKIESDGANSALFEGDQSIMEDRLLYFMSQVTEDLWLSDDNGSYSLITHHFERNYNTTNAIHIQMAFKKPIGQDFTFNFNDRIIGVGMLKFRIANEDIERIPELNF